VSNKTEKSGYVVNDETDYRGFIVQYVAEYVVWANSKDEAVELASLLHDENPEGGFDAKEMF
jgi:hypothetical protein